MRVCKLTVRVNLLSEQKFTFLENDSRYVTVRRLKRTVFQMLLLIPENLKLSCDPDPLGQWEYPVTPGLEL